MRDKKELSDDNWVTKRNEVRAEHLLEQAPMDLRVWKPWIAENCPCIGKKGAGGAAVSAPAAGVNVEDALMSWCSVNECACPRLGTGFDYKFF